MGDAAGRAGRRLHRWIGGAMAIALALLAACGEPEFQYVKSDKGQAFFKVPHDWRVFEEDELLKAQELTDRQREAAASQLWALAFDGSPSPSLGHVLAPSDHPWGIARSRQLSPDERDTYSLSSLRRELLPVDPATNDGGAELLGVRDLHRPGGLRGNEFVANFRLPTGVVLTIHQVALVDARTSTVQILVVGCTARCYEANERVIKQIVRSWTVKER